MDDAMIGRLLQTYGAPTTARNANAARQFFAANPDIAEKRAMGMRGSGIDDNSDVFGSMLDKFIQQSDNTPAPAGTVEVSQPQLETTQAATAPNAPRKKMSEPSRQGEYGPGPSPSRQGEYSAPVTRESVRGGKGFGLDDVLTALLGLTATGALAPKAAPSATPPMKALPRAVGNDGQLLENPYPDGQKRLTYQPALEEGGANARAAEADKTKTITNDPALNEQGRRAQLQAEIDAENEAAARKLQDQIMQRNNEANTRKLLQQGKKVVTGR